VGWKIGRGLAEGEEHLEPVIGYLTSRTRVTPGDFCASAGLREPRVDAELAIEIGAGEQPVGYGAAVELVDVTRPPSDFESIVAGNIWHRAFATGPLHAEPPPDVVRAVVSVNGAVAGEGEKRVDPLETARVVSELLRAVGEQLRAGDLIIAGSIVQIPVEVGDVIVELESVGAIGVRLG
jgi:hypothetical protein